jgi:hypothetical protein
MMMKGQLAKYRIGDVIREADVYRMTKSTRQAGKAKLRILLAGALAALVASASPAAAAPGDVGKLPGSHDRYGGVLELPDFSGQREANHCVTNAGVDLNALFGVPDQIVTRFCSEVSAGEHWRPFGFWIVNSFNETFPAGYVPSGPTPIEDFVTKLVEVKVVVDGGTRQEKTLVFEPGDVLRTDVTSDQLEPGFPQLPMAVTLPRMKPLSIGQHTRELVWVLSAQHCDGFGTSVDDNCLPAGDVSFGVGPFTVTAPAD